MMNGLVERQGYDGYCRLILNRPDRRNAMNAELLEEVLGALEAVASDDSVRALVLTGAGSAFCVGGDLATGPGGGVWGEGSIETKVGRLRRYMRSSQLLHQMPKLTIAAINGACAGAGLAWACAADIRIASESAIFNTAFLTAGLSGDFGGTWTLSRIVGPARARELYLRPRRFDAEEAWRIGLVAEVVAEADLQERALEAARSAAAAAPIALRALKANLNDSLNLSLSELMDIEAERHLACSATHDAVEAASAFLEKRTPVFRGA